MRMFNREKFLDGLLRYINRTLPVSETMPDAVCAELSRFLKSSEADNGAGLLDDMYIEYCPEYERGQSLWELSRYGEDCLDDDRTILKETAVAFGRYFCDGQDVVKDDGKALQGIYLHRHQTEALQAYRRGENILVCTGTGSGKTECFLIPIIDKLLRERKVQSAEDFADVARRHVHAMIMYPMNALVNDQVKRLRQIISYIDFTGDLAGKSITFGQFTGDLKREKEIEDGIANAIEASAQLPVPYCAPVEGYVQNLGGVDVSHPIPSEYVTRDQWDREGAADILVTNYSMMEHMLIRPDRDSVFQGGNWDFVVLDEAHSYTGSTGTEIAWQMRRLERRLRSFVTEGYRLPQFIATSATLVKGDEAAQETAAREFMKGLFPIGAAPVFVGVDHLTAFMPTEGVASLPLAENVEELVEDTAAFEARFVANEKACKFADRMAQIEAAGGTVSVADALWLATHPSISNVTFELGAGGWIDYCVKLVVQYSSTAYGDFDAQYDFWRDTLHNYDSREFSPDGKFLGNKLSYLRTWGDRAQGVDCGPVTGDEFKYLMLAAQVVLEMAKEAGRPLPSFNRLAATVKILFDFIQQDESEAIRAAIPGFVTRWSNLLPDLDEADFTPEGHFAYKEKLAASLLVRKDVQTVLSVLSKSRLCKLSDLVGLESGPDTQEGLLRVLQMAGLAKRANQRKPLIDVKCHQAFRGVSNIGVWFDEAGYHFTRSEGEYVGETPEARHKVFTLGICRECGQLYLLGYTGDRAILQNGDVLWRKPVGEIRYMHAVALPFTGELPYAPEKLVTDDDRDQPMPRLENQVGARANSPWAKWREKRLVELSKYSVNLTSGNVIPGSAIGYRDAYWCLNVLDDGEAGVMSFIPKCPCCGTNQPRRDGATYGIITQYEAGADQFSVAALESFAHATVVDGYEKDAKVLSFSDSRQGASSLALNFETASFRSFSETAIRSAISAYSEALSDRTSELGKKIYNAKNHPRYAEVRARVNDAQDNGDDQAENVAKAELAQLRTEVVAAPLTIENLVAWGLLDKGIPVPGVYDIDSIDANGRRRWMTLPEAKRFDVMSTLVDSSSRSRTGVKYYSRTLRGVALTYEGLDGDLLQRCLQRIFRALTKCCVIENSGNDYELRDGNFVYRPDRGGTPDDGYEQRDKFTGREAGNAVGREYVREAIEKFFPLMADDRRRRVALARYFWDVLCDNGILKNLEGVEGFKKLDYGQLCSDIVVEMAPGAEADVQARYPFSIQEHTAQISGMRGAFYQRRFASGEINVLSCSTTFEMGIDVGGLNNVFLANLPPSTANYKQRAGRAGRRPGALAQVVTYVREGSWADCPLLRMMDGEVTPPKIYLAGAVYKYRHLRAEALRFFLKYVAENPPVRPNARGGVTSLKWNNFGSFLMGFRYTWRYVQEGGRRQRFYVRDTQSRIEESVVEQCGSRWLSGADGSQYSALACDEYVSAICDVMEGEDGAFTDLEKRPSLDLIFQLVGDGLVSGLDDNIPHWTVSMARPSEDFYIKRGGCYVPEPVEEGDIGHGFQFVWPGRDDSMRLPLRDRKLLLMRRVSDIQVDDVNDGDWLSTEIDAYMSTTNNGECPPMIRRLLNENTISALSSCGIIPKYGFPIDVIKLVTDGRGAKDVDLERDMMIGLFEYAPGQVVVANKHEYDVFPDRRGVLFNDISYTVQHDQVEGNGLVAWCCLDCKHIEEHEFNVCPDCSGTNRQKIALVRPDAFKAHDKGRRHGFVRKTPKGQRIVRLASSVTGNSFRVPGTSLDVMFDANRTIGFYNANKGKGFNLVQDGNVGDVLANAFLTHNIHTDVVVWKIDQSLFQPQGALERLLPQNSQDLNGLAYGRNRFRNAMASALAAVRLAAVRHLQVQDREIEAFVYPNGNSFWWVIYDAAQGGGGNVLPLAKNRPNDECVDETVRAILEEALTLVSHCPCSEGLLAEHSLNSDFVSSLTPVPEPVYKTLQTMGVSRLDEFYREAKACSACISPRLGWNKSQVFDCLDAAVVLRAVFTEHAHDATCEESEEDGVETHGELPANPETRIVDGAAFVKIADEERRGLQFNVQCLFNDGHVGWYRNGMDVTTVWGVKQ